MGILEWLNEDVGTKRRDRRPTPAAKPWALPRPMWIWHGLGIYMAGASLVHGNGAGVGIVAAFWFVGVRVLRHVGQMIKHRQIET